MIFLVDQEGQSKGTGHKFHCVKFFISQASKEGQWLSDCIYCFMGKLRSFSVLDVSKEPSVLKATLSSQPILLKV